MTIVTMIFAVVMVMVAVWTMHVLRLLVQRLSEKVTHRALATKICRDHLHPAVANQLVLSPKGCRPSS